MTTHIQFAHRLYLRIHDDEASVLCLVSGSVSGNAACLIHLFLPTFALRSLSSFFCGSALNMETIWSLERGRVCMTKPGRESALVVWTVDVTVFKLGGPFPFGDANAAEMELIDCKKLIFFAGMSEGRRESQSQLYLLVGRLVSRLLPPVRASILLPPA